MEELELVQIESDQVSRSEDGQQDAETAEQQGVEGPAPGPPGAQAQEHEEVHGRGQRGQHHPCGGRGGGTCEKRGEEETQHSSASLTAGDDEELLLCL